MRRFANINQMFKNNSGAGVMSTKLKLGAIAGLSAAIALLAAGVMPARADELSDLRANQ